MANGMHTCTTHMQSIILKKVTTNNIILGFKTAYGILAIGGLHGLPLWLFAWEYNLFECLPQWLIYLGKKTRTYFLNLLKS